MATLISVLTDDLKNIYPDATTARCERALNRAHSDLIARCPEVARTSVILTPLSVGIGAYDLPAETCEVLDLFYVPGSGASTRLSYYHREAMNKEVVDINGIPWITAGNGTPQFWHVGSEMGTGNQSDLKITVYPKPDTATGVTYPYLLAYISKVMTLTNTDTIPEGLADGDNYYITRASAYLAGELRTTGEMAAQLQISQIALANAVTQYNLVSRETDPRENFVSPRPKN